MNKIVLLLAVVALFATSCITQKKCNNKFPPITIEKLVTIHDSIFEKVYVHDTTFTVIVGKDTTIYDTDTVLVFKGMVNSKPVTIKGEFADATAQVVNSKLNVKLEERAKNLQITLKDAIKEKLLYKYYYEQSKEKQVVIKEVKVGKFYVWFFYIVLGITTLYTGLKFKQDTV
jgi:hypothetical protein